MRDEQLLRQIRPVLDLNTRESGPEEAFQNQTLRPILKMQHALLVEVFRQHIHKRQDGFRKLPPVKRLEWISHAVRSDQRLRILLAGIVIGQFTLTEYRQFVENEPEYMRRMADLLIQRLQSAEESF